MTVAPHLLRRYVIDRAAGRMPHLEWSFLAPDVGAWVLADHATAQRHEHHRRVRQDGRPWCEVLGHRTEVRDDQALQVYFLTIAQDEWSGLALAAMRAPTRCQREWRAAGERLIAAVDLEMAAPSGTATPRPLGDWPKARGTGPRSMLPN
jgi:hypothetical protein